MKSKILISSLIGSSLALALVLSAPAGAQAENDGLSADVNVRASVNLPQGIGANNKHPLRPSDDSGRGSMMDGRVQMMASSSKPMMGKPAIVGKVTAVSGTTLTVDALRRSATSTATTTFMVDASKAVVRKGNATTTVSTISTGDTVLVQGTLNGTSITASLIIDGVRSSQDSSRGDDMRNEKSPFNEGRGLKVGFFGGLKNFFSKLFGF